MRLTALSRSAAVLLSAMVVSSNAAAAVEQKTLTLQARDLQSLRIDADEGFLHVRGVAGSDVIEVVAEIESQKLPYRLTLEQKGPVAVLKSDIEGHRWPFGRTAFINLTIRVPDWLALDIIDDSGAIEVTDMRTNVSIEDDSGDILVKNQHGNLTVHDDSGAIEVRSISGNVKIEDDSGSLAAEDIGGDVDIRDDSGAIRVTNVAGHVAIRDDSGSIEVNNVQKGLTIYDRGSGRLTTNAIHGGIDIKD